MKETLFITNNINAEIKVHKLIKDGYNVQCMSCGLCFKTTPRTLYEDGHGGRELKECRCGSDLFISLQEVLENNCKNITVVSRIIDGEPTIVLKERNFKYCTCDGGRYQVHTGDAETECSGMHYPLVIENTRGYAKFKCDGSGQTVIIIKEDSKTLNKLMSHKMGYFITPITDDMRNIETTDVL